jgi:hypothetical protein
MTWRPVAYHEGQREVQCEANSTKAADKLSTWVGPVIQYANEADLIVLASEGAGGELNVGALSGPAPLVSASEFDGGIMMHAPIELATRLATDKPWGGIVINPAAARRSRVAGMPVRESDVMSIPFTTAFTNCRKYITPTASTGSDTHLGPTAIEPCDLDDAWIVDTIAHGETAFLVTATPDGVADVSHRGGPPGFLRYTPAAREIAWTEFLGDGMFISTGNIRSRARFALLVLDFASGDAVRLDGDAQYTNVRTDRHERVAALVQADEPFPVQGRIVATVTRATRLRSFCLPRVRVERRTRITSADSTAVQHPQ